MATAAIVDPLIGRTIAGKYRVLSRVGAGGMGAVYKAQQIALDKPVAVKVLHAALEVDSQFVARFHVEAKAASMFDHPSSTRVIDFGEEPDGLLYIVMEFLEGHTLLDVVQKDFPLVPSRVADILRQVLAALAVAHERGILHRDLKPENIVILQGRDDEGHSHDVVKVCDFGIAKLATVENAGGTPSSFGGAITLRDGPNGASAERVSTEPSAPVKAISTTPSGVQITPAPPTANFGAAPPITRVGLIIGTPEYMSPEQARGEPVDARSDLYSVGCVLYHLITGRPPFHGDTPLVTATLHATIDAKKPSEIQPDVDPTLERVCLRAMQKNPDDRYATAREMRADLKSLVQAHGETQPSFLPSSAESSARMQPIGADAMAALDHQPGSKPRKSGFVLGASLLLVGLASALWIFVRPAMNHDSTTSTIDPQNGVDGAAMAVPAIDASAHLPPMTSATATASANVNAATSVTTHPSAIPGNPTAATPFPNAKVTLFNVATVQGVSKSAVADAIKHRERVLQRCYVAALTAASKKGESSAAAGTATLDVQMDNGKIGTASLDDDFGLSVLKGCLAHDIPGVAVAGSMDPGAHATVTLSFSND